MAPPKHYLLPNSWYLHNHARGRMDITPVGKMGKLRLLAIQGLLLLEEDNRYFASL